jgi:hypothetical protein
LTINLLPPAWAEFYQSQSSGIRVWTMTLIASITIWSTFLFVFMVFIFLSLQAQALEEGDALAKNQELNNAVSRVNEVNLLAENVIKFESSIVYPQSIINPLSASRPEGVSISYYKVNYETGEIILRGVAATRMSLLDFKNSLESLEKITSVSLPISILVQEADINYEIRAIYGDFVRSQQAAPKLQI